MIYADDGGGLCALWQLRPWDPPDPSRQTASRSSGPFFHNTHALSTERWSERSRKWISKNRPHMLCPAYMCNVVSDLCTRNMCTRYLISHVINEHLVYRMIPDVTASGGLYPVLWLISLQQLSTAVTYQYRSTLSCQTDCITTMQSTYIHGQLITCTHVTKPYRMKKN